MILLFETVLSLSLTSTYAQRTDVSSLRSRLSQSDLTRSHSDGRLEVYYKQRWRTVCDETFGDDEARVVCFNISLGVFRNCGRVVSNSYGPTVTPVSRLDIRCGGGESSLGECRYRDRTDGGDAAAAHHCTHSSNHVAVDCRKCHATSTGRSRRNSIVPYYTNPDTNSSSGSSTFWMGGLFIFFFFAWMVVVICCILCHCYRRRMPTSESTTQSPAQNIFMTSASGADNPAMSTSQPDAVALAGLPSYDEVIANANIYKRIDAESCLPSYSVAVGQPSDAQEDSDSQTQSTSS